MSEQLISGLGEILDWAPRITLIIGVITWIIRTITRKNFKSILLKFYGSQNITILLPLRKLENKEVISDSDFIAANTIDKFLSNYGFTTKIDFIQPNSKFDFLEGGKIVICGPKTSNIVNTAMKMQDKIKFIEYENKWVLENVPTSKRYISPIDKKKPGSDIAYLARASATGDAENSFISIAGIHAEGSAIATHFLANKKNMKDLHSKTNGNLFTSIISGRFNISTKYPYSSKLEEINPGDKLIGDNYFLISEDIKGCS